MMRLLCLVSLFLLALSSLESVYGSDISSRENNVLTFEYEQLVDVDHCCKRGVNFLPLSVKGTITFKNDKFFDGPEDNIKSFQMSVVYKPNPISDEYIEQKQGVQRRSDQQEIILPGLTWTEEDLKFWFSVPSSIVNPGFDYSKDLVGQVINLESGHRFGKDADNNFDQADFGFTVINDEETRPHPVPVGYFAFRIYDPSDYAIFKKHIEDQKRDIDVDEVIELMKASNFRLKSVRRAETVKSVYGNLNSNFPFRVTYKARKLEYKRLVNLPNKSTAIQSLLSSYEGKDVDEIPLSVRGVIGFSKLDIHGYGELSLTVEPNYMDYLKFDLIAVGGDNVEYSLHTWGSTTLYAQIEFYQLDFTKELVGQVDFNGRIFGHIEEDKQSGGFYIGNYYTGTDIQVQNAYYNTFSLIFNSPFYPWMDGRAQEEKSNISNSDYLKSVNDKIEKHQMTQTTHFESANKKRITYSEIEELSFMLRDLIFDLVSFKSLTCESAPQQPAKTKNKKYGEYNDCLFPQNKQMECYSYKALFLPGSEPTSCYVEECSSARSDAFNRKCSKVSGGKSICNIDSARKQVCVKRESCTGSRRGDTCVRIYEFFGKTQNNNNAEPVVETGFVDEMCKFKSSSQDTLLATVVAPFNDDSMEFKSNHYCH